MYYTTPDSAGQLPGGIKRVGKEALTPQAHRERLMASGLANTYPIELSYDPNATAPVSTFTYDAPNLWGSLPSGVNGQNWDIMGSDQQNVFVPGYFGAAQRPILGQPPIMEASFFKRQYLTGLDKQLIPITNFDEMFRYYLDVAVAEIETRLGFFLYPRVLITDALQRGFRPGVDFDLEIREQDFDAADFYNWGWLTLQYGPVMQITNLNMVYPTGEQILSFPMSWVKPMMLSRQIRLVPPQGALSQIVIGPGGALVTLIGGLMQNFPALFFTDYVAGMWPFPRNIVHAIAAQTTIHFLEVLSDAISKGMREYTAVTGGMTVSKRFSDPDTRKGAGQAFEPRIRQYEAQIDKIILDYQQAYFSASDLSVV